MAFKRIGKDRYRDRLRFLALTDGKALKIPGAVLGFAAEIEADVGLESTEAQRQCHGFVLFRHVSGGTALLLHPGIDIIGIKDLEVIPDIGTDPGRQRDGGDIVPVPAGQQNIGRDQKDRGKYPDQLAFFRHGSQSSLLLLHRVFTDTAPFLILL